MSEREKLTLVLLATVCAAGSAEITAFPRSFFLISGHFDPAPLSVKSRLESRVHHDLGVPEITFSWVPSRDVTDRHTQPGTRAVAN